MLKLAFYFCFLIIFHKPYALVSWGRTLEISHVTSSGVCEWLHSTSSSLNLTKETQRPKYSLYLTKAAPEHRVLGTTGKVSNQDQIKAKEIACTLNYKRYKRYSFACISV